MEKSTAKFCIEDRRNLTLLSLDIKNIGQLFKVELMINEAEVGCQIIIHGVREQTQKVLNYLASLFRPDSCVCHIFDYNEQDEKKLISHLKKAETCSGCSIQRGSDGYFLIYGVGQEEVGIAVSYLDNVLVKNDSPTPSSSRGNDDCFIIGGKMKPKADISKKKLYSNHLNAFCRNVENDINFILDNDDDNDVASSHPSNNSDSASHINKFLWDNDDDDSSDCGPAELHFAIDLRSDDDEPIIIDDSFNEEVTRKKKKKRKGKRKAKVTTNSETPNLLGGQMDKLQSLDKLDSFSSFNNAILNANTTLSQQFKQTCFAPPFNHRRSLEQRRLRRIVIDGSNIAMTHGLRKVFSCKGIALVVKYFENRGHQEITVFVPQWRRSRKFFENVIRDEGIMEELFLKGQLTFTPSRSVGGKVITSYDDKFILSLAADEGGIVVSNDQYRDLYLTEEKFRETIEKRILQVTFVGDKVMFPDDPLGRKGPSLDEFLQHVQPVQRLPCPQKFQRCLYEEHNGMETFFLPTNQKLLAPAVALSVLSSSSSLGSSNSSSHPLSTGSKSPNQFFLQQGMTCIESKRRPPHVTDSLRKQLLNLPYGLSQKVDELLTVYPAMTDIAFFKDLL